MTLARYRLVGTIALAAIFVVALVVLAGHLLSGGDTPDDRTVPVGPKTSTVSAAPPSTAPPSSAPNTPASVLNLTNWKLTLPVGDKDATEIEQPKLRTFRDPRFFHVGHGGVVLRAPVEGVTTSGSEYPRSELREMTDHGKKEAKWSNKTGTHVMTVIEAITHLPAKKPEVVAGQIHDDSDDVVMIRLEKNRLFVEAGGNDIGVLDPNYQLGKRFTVTITATPAGIEVAYNGSPKVHYKKVGKDFYFKAGCYTQSNTDHDDQGAYGEVVIYGLHVSHR